MKVFNVICGLLILMSACCIASGNEYVIGDLNTLAHLVEGKVSAIGPNRLRLSNFNYDGKGPDAFLYVGIQGKAGDQPNSDGEIIPDEKGSTEVLSAYTNADIILTLPGDMKVWHIKWLSVWCRKFTVDFGHIIFPSNLESKVPKPLVIGQLSQLAHGVRSGDVTILDTKRFEIKNLYYDGQGPDAFFIVGKGNPTGSGTKVPDERGSLQKLSRYDGQTVVITLPGDLTVKDIEYLSMYCIFASQDFGNVRIPSNPFVPMYYEMPEDMNPLQNCQQMHPRLNIAWSLDGLTLTLEMIGTLRSGEYMAFGLSGSESGTSMIGAQVIVATMNDINMPVVKDYLLSQYSQCANGRGSCPAADNQVTVMTSSIINGITKVKATRPIWRTDKTKLFVVWAIGVYNFGLDLVTKHSLKNTEAIELDFAQSGSIPCAPLTPITKDNMSPWPMSRIQGKDTNVFKLTMGPAGGPRGYPAITGSPSWGIAWYVNGVLIPEITLKRGETFIFEVNGGNENSNSAKYHPFYLTSSSKGGRGARKGTSDEDTSEKVFMLTDENGDLVEAGEGPYCEYEGDANPDNYDTSTAFAAMLQLQCMQGNPGRYTWTPDLDTPDTIYYQCYTHQYLGWKIRIVDDYSSGSHIERSQGLIMMLLCLCIIFYLSH